MKQHRVRSVVIDGTIRRVKFCPGCETDKIAEAGSPDSEFWVSSHYKGRPSFCPRCKECRLREQHERMESDPEFAERTRARWRANRQRRLQSAENREKARASYRAYYYRRVATAQGRAEVAEAARMGYTLRQEQAGKTVKRGRTVVDGTKPRVPAGPFRDWLLAYRETAELRTAEALARELGLTPRRVLGVLGRESPRVSLDVVDRALVNARWSIHVWGKLIVTIDDLYPLDEQALAA